MEENKPTTEQTKIETEGLRLIIPLGSYRKIMAYTTICDIEISGFAEVEYNQARNAFVVGEVYLIKQNCTGTGTHMEEEDVSSFELERIKDGATMLPRLWWHSHVNMEAFFSGIDEDTLKNRQNDTFAIALVVNKKKHMKAKAYLYNEITQKIMGFEFKTTEQTEVDPLPVSIEFEYERIPEVLKQEVDDKVKTKIYTYKGPHRAFPRPGTDPDLVGAKERGAGSSIVKPLFLPKDKVAAQTRIDEKGLVKRWDFQKEEYVYEDPYSGQVWIDYWETLKQYDNRNDDFSE